MNPWNPRRPDPRNPRPPEYWDQQTFNSSNGWSPEYWDRQSIDSRDERSPEYWNRESIDSRDRWSPEYWDQQQSQPWPAESLSQQPTYPWSHKYRDQHPVGFKNSRSQGYYRQTRHRPPLLGHSSISHETRFQLNSRRNDFAFHPYRHMDHVNSYHQRNYPTVATRSLGESSKDSAKKRHKKASTGTPGNCKAVSDSANTTKSALNTSNTTSNAANETNDPTVATRSLSESSKASAKKHCKKSSAGNHEAVSVNANTTESALNTSNTASNAANDNDKVENNDASEDVLYLYSVDPNEGKLVELVDLSENSQVSENQDLFASESNNSNMPVSSNYEASDLTEPKDSTCDDLANTLLNNQENEHTSKEQGECGNACCNMCNKSYEELYNNKCDLYIARCGHLFCVLCIPQLKIKRKCIKCKNVISNLRKIFL